MAVPNPVVKKRCPFAYQGERHDCKHCLVLEMDVYDQYNIRHIEHEFSCECEGECAYEKGER